SAAPRIGIVSDVWRRYQTSGSSIPAPGSLRWIVYVWAPGTAFHDRTAGVNEPSQASAPAVTLTPVGGPGIGAPVGSGGAGVPQGRVTISPFTSLDHPPPAEMTP